MFTRLTLAAIAVAGCAGLALPAQAATTPVKAADDMAACYNTGNSKDINDDTEAIAARLGEHGYNVSGVEEWGSCIRAYVTDSHGRTSMELFDPDTLKPINPTNVG
ncbi:hypothetical protein GCM10011321_25020 [Youhaiella tibetensis]|uniref:PepSY domain-containing protein n=1 Tax=Paradevosia tibetensis TaxID=1447062 RepID=A0A5B9DKL6_9HYPH|nr:PepSY domain-containing protein [Youhaiella tibetensis]QEE19475.1 PepSY domain-containing protein [Youhaiella tibetensis]GGF32783.1 hypothetical protein GCM10011321_25020 [Youhaiella tibetensis]